MNEERPGSTDEKKDSGRSSGEVIPKGGIVITPPPEEKPAKTGGKDGEEER